MNEKLKIYLADLTYNTVTLSTEAFPLNIGYIAAYCLKRFPNVDIKLFKYISDLEKSLDDPPDILGLSNYAWNYNITREFSKIVHEKNSHCVTVWGGANIPLDIPSQQNFFDKNKELDIYVPLEGEIGFANIVEKVLQKFDVKNFLIEGCITRTNDGKIQGLPSQRMPELDSFPSPYTTGILDSFFDGKLSPMIQTNRGCPFTCTFCVDGNSSVMKVNRFSLERVKSELSYIAKHIPKKTHSMIISDLNFGMIPRDLEICDMISKTQTEYNYPTQIHATTGKNSKEKIIDAIKRLNGALRLWMSVQSMDENVLANIKRSNISKEEIIALAPTIKAAKLRTVSEVILGLPGETYDSHISTLKKLVNGGIDQIAIYTCMMLNGAEMNTPEQRKKWGIQTRFRVIPKDFVKLSSGKVVLEIEEVITATNTMMFEDYLRLRMLAFSIYVTSIGVVYDALIKFLHEKNVDVFELFDNTIKQKDSAPEPIKNLLNDFYNSTITELWDSPEDIELNYQKESEYQKLLNGEAGINVIQYYHSFVVTKLMGLWTYYILDIARQLLKKDSETMLQFTDITNYCIGMSYKILDKDRMSDNPEFEFNYNIKEWLESKKHLSHFKQSNKTQFQLTEKQFTLVQDKLDIFGDTIIGKAQVVKRTPIELLWRKPVIVKKVPEAA